MKRIILQYAAVFLLLVILPALSWYYLGRGLEYRKATIAELGDFGKIAPLPYSKISGELIEADYIRGKVLLIYAFPSNDLPSAERLMSELTKIHNQFNERPDVLFLLLGPPEEALQMQATIETYKMNDPDQVLLLANSTGDFGLSAQKGLDPAALVALADTSGTVRQYYDFRDGNRIRRLVEHTAMLMPIQEKEKPVLKRETEK